MRVLTDLDLGEWIGVTRRRQNLTLTQLAEKAGLHRNTLAQAEAGDMRLTVGTLIKIFEALGYSLSIRLVDKDGDDGA